MPTNKKVKKKKPPQICVELKDGKRVCFGGTIEAMGYFIDLIGSGDLKIKSITNPLSHYKIKRTKWVKTIK